MGRTRALSPSRKQAATAGASAGGGGGSNGSGATPSSSISDALNKGEVAGLSRQRTWTTIVCFIVMGTFVSLGHPGLITMTTFINVMMFKEAIAASRDAEKEASLPLFRQMYYMWFGTAIFATYGHVLKPQLRTLDFVRIYGVSIADMAESYHLMATFTLYTVCFVLLVISLSVTTHRKRAASSTQMKTLVEYQLSQFAYSQTALVIIVGQSSFIIENLFHGIVWWCLPALLVIINDIAAYICGKWWGRTSLIVLSPKKTVEGFVGAIVLTVSAGVLLAHYFVRSPAMVCSLYNTDGTSKGFNWTVPLLGVGPSTVDACDDEFTHSGLYRTQPAHELAPALASIPFVHSLPEISPFQVHTAVLSLFASIIAPFGGFFASAVKRAFGIKDWGDTIPGQGGFNDRFDCQLMMHAFVGVYYAAFVKQSTTSTISALLSMPPEQQQRALCARVVQDSIAQHVGGDVVAGMRSFCAGAVP